MPTPITVRHVKHDFCPIIRHTITAGPGCDLWSLRFHQPVKIRQWVPLAAAGDNLAAAPRGRAAIIFLETENSNDFESTYSCLLNRELYSFSE